MYIMPDNHKVGVFGNKAYLIDALSKTITPMGKQRKELYDKRIDPHNQVVYKPRYYLLNDNIIS